MKTLHSLAPLVLGLILNPQLSNAVEQAAPASQPPASPAAANQKLPYGVDDIVKMSKAGVGDDVITAYIGNSGTIYNLNSDVIVRLHDLGVSDRVVGAMLDQRKRAMQAAAMAPQPAANPAPAQPAEAPAPASEPVVAAPSTVYTIPYYSYPYFYSPYYYYGGYWPSYYGGYWGGWYGGISLGFYNRYPYCGYGYGYRGPGYYGYWHRPSSWSTWSAPTRPWGGYRGGYVTSPGGAYSPVRGGVVRPSPGPVGGFRGGFTGGMRSSPVGGMRGGFSGGMRGGFTGGARASFAGGMRGGGVAGGHGRR